MTIVVKQTGDFKNALEIAEKSKEYFQTGFDKLEKDLQKHLLYGAFAEGKMVGFITFKENGKDVIEISWMAVLPEYRNKGIGTKLLKQALKTLKDKYSICKVKTLAETHKDEGYAKTRNFYKQIGFISLEIIQPYPGWDKDNPCQIFVKPLK